MIYYFILSICLIAKLQYLMFGDAFITRISNHAMINKFDISLTNLRYLLQSMNVHNYKYIY